MEKKIEDLKRFHKNPRKITDKQFELLENTMQEYGDLSGIVLNIKTGEVIGGNQRTQFFKQHPNECKIVLTKKYSSPTEQGTVAFGYIEFGEEQFSYREVEWDSKKSDRANIIANKAGGFFDNDVLANEFDIDDLRMGGFEDFELGMFNDEIEMDNADSLTKTMDSYLDGNIKQIVLYFKNEDYAELIPKLETLVQEMGVDNYSDMFVKLLETYENNSGK